MKRLIFLLVGVLLCAWSAEGQLLRMGARIGIGTGAYDFESLSIDGGTLEPAGDRVGGYQAALMLRLSIPTFIYIQPELQFSQRDYIFGLKFPSEPKEYKTLRTYRLDVPVLVGFKFGSVRLFGGPVWRIGSKEYVRGVGDTPFEVIFNNNDIAATAGVGVEFDGLLVEVRYTGYLDQTSSMVKVASSRHKVGVTHDGTVQINFGLLF